MWSREPRTTSAVWSTVLFCPPSEASCEREFDAVNHTVIHSAVRSTMPEIQIALYEKNPARINYLYQK